MAQNYRLRTIALSVLSAWCLCLAGDSTHAFVYRTQPRSNFNALKRRHSISHCPVARQSSLCASADGSSIPESVTVDGETETTKVSPFVASVPIPTEWRGEVLKVLQAVVDPDLGQDIVTLGFVQNLKLDESTRKVTFDVELTTPACPVKEAFEKDCHDLVLNLPFVNSVGVTMTAQEPTNGEISDATGMAGIGAVIAVSSCKGGVGKSTTSVNLAYALQSLGATVGIFDCDVYGPSLPTMIEPDDDIVRFIGRQIAPLQRNGVRLMSFGYINDGSAIMRGPMVEQLLAQFLSVTQWGSLDYLILDMPPGTGDIQLTLTQRLNITAAVIVTTPQELSFADVVRGVEMFDTVNVPCIAVVENMAYYDNDPKKSINNADELQKDVEAMLAEKGLLKTNDGNDDNNNKLAEELVQLVLNNAKTEPVRIFGPGHKQRLSNQWGIEHTYSMPLMDTIAANGDSGTPYVLGHPDSPQTKIYKDLARSVVSEVAKTKFRNKRPEIEYVEEFHLLMVDEEPLEPAELRRACRCAACVEELTGRQLLKPSDVSDDIRPLRMSSTGNYALSVDWSDGHRSLYPYRQIKTLIFGEDETEPNGESEETPSQQPRASDETAEEPKLETITSSPPTTTIANATEETTCSCCP